jgi:hypothetical protein
MGQVADYRSVSQRGGMRARHLRSRSGRPALFSQAGSRADHRRGSPSHCSASRPFLLVTAPPNPTRSRPQRWDLFEYAGCLPALCPPCRLKGALVGRVKGGSHSLRTRRRSCCTRDQRRRLVRSTNRPGFSSQHGARDRARRDRYDSLRGDSKGEGLSGINIICDKSLGPVIRGILARPPSTRASIPRR